MQQRMAEDEDQEQKHACGKDGDLAASDVANHPAALAHQPACAEQRISGAGLGKAACDANVHDARRARAWTLAKQGGGSGFLIDDFPASEVERALEVVREVLLGRKPAAAASR